MNFWRQPCDPVATTTNAAVCPQKFEKWVLVATILASSMAFIDGAVVNIALPALQNAFQAKVSQIQWVIEAYSLTLAALLLVGGSLGDLYGRRLIFLIGVLIFSLASFWCGIAPTISQLITARTIQGIGAALLVPGSLTLITTSIAEKRRGQAIGTWAGFTAITTAGAPILGGWLIEHSSWRWIFFLNLPLAVVVFITTIFFIKESKSRQATQLDISGVILATVGLACIVYGLLEWNNSLFIILIEVIGVCALIAFIYNEARVKSPMMPLEMFNSRNFSGANLLTFFLYFALNGFFFFFPLLLIQIEGYSATAAGAAFLPFILLMFFLSRWAGGLVKQFGPRIPLVVGPAIAALGFALFLKPAQGTYWLDFFPAMIVLGFGMTVSVAPLTTVVMSSATEDYVGAASGINNAVSRVAGLLAIAVFGLIMTIIFNHFLLQGLQAESIPTSLQTEIFDNRAMLAAIPTQNNEAKEVIHMSFMSGYHAILFISSVLALLSSLSAFLFIRKK